MVFDWEGYTIGEKTKKLFIYVVEINPGTNWGVGQSHYCAGSVGLSRAQVVVIVCPGL